MIDAAFGLDSIKIASTIFIEEDLLRQLRDFS